MKDELTTAMHAEFLGHEISEFDLRVLSVLGATRRGNAFKEALLLYELTEEEYEANIERALRPE